MAEKAGGGNDAKLSKGAFALKAIGYLVSVTPTIKVGGVETPRTSKGIHTVITTDGNGANFGALWRAYFGACSKEELRSEVDTLIAKKVLSGHPTRGGFMLYKHGDEKSGRSATIDPKKAQASIAAMLK